jgi:hypothetical protein
MRLPAIVNTDRLWDGSAEESRSRTPGTERASIARASITDARRPSLMFGTHSIRDI